MKYIKLFEQNINKPKVGDYILCKPELTGVPTFITNKIGRIININNDKYRVSDDSIPINVQYENIPEKFKKNYFDENNSIILYDDEIIYFSPNKEDCEAYIATNKYNL